MATAVAGSTTSGWARSTAARSAGPGAAPERGRSPVLRAKTRPRASARSGMTWRVQGGPSTRRRFGWRSTRPVVSCVVLECRPSSTRSDVGGAPCQQIDCRSQGPPMKRRSFRTTTAAVLVDAVAQGARRSPPAEARRLVERGAVYVRGRRRRRPGSSLPAGTAVLVVLEEVGPLLPRRARAAAPAAGPLRGRERGGGGQAGGPCRPAHARRGPQPPRRRLRPPRRAGRPGAPPRPGHHRGHRLRKVAGGDVGAGGALPRGEGGQAVPGGRRPGAAAVGRLHACVLPAIRRAPVDGEPGDRGWRRRTELLRLGAAPRTSPWSRPVPTPGARTRSAPISRRSALPSPAIGCTAARRRCRGRPGGAGAPPRPGAGPRPSPDRSHRRLARPAAGRTSDDGSRCSVEEPPGAAPALPTGAEAGTSPPPGRRRR